MGDCVDSSVDDVGFLERVMQSVQAKYAGAGQMFVSGNSAGGMMVYELLCESEWFAKNLAAAAVFSGGVGEGYACRGGRASARVPLLVLHGQDDEVIGYRKGTSVDGSPFEAVVDTVKAWAGMRGCGSEGEPPDAPFFAAQKIECRDYCRPAAAAAAAAAAGGAQMVAEQGAKMMMAAADAARNGNGKAAAAKNGASKGAPNSSSSSKNAAAATPAAKNAGAAADAKNRQLGSVAQAAPMRACSVPGGKHNLHEVIRSFHFDVSAAWFAKQAGPSWGATPPS